MTSAPQPTSLSAVLDTVERVAREHRSVCLTDVRDAMGDRGFGPMLMLPALVIVSPLSGIPTLPTMTALLVALVAVQILAGAKSLWIPRRLGTASLSQAHTERALRALRPMARFVDRLVRPRLRWATGPIAMRAVAVLCLLIALTMPPLEFLPFVSSLAAVVIVVLALALTARDGLLVLLGFALAAAGFAAAVYTAVEVAG
ncbi:exopolysaccharide biosynthesis protein [Lutibaculum baratangense]|uniref:Exopolysaccharide synthesis, ExoD n=1 Tax=Lutibaculum baratangense AMV1 TaxID=631454 RepID=V4R904_9HYPH|nr:exopolysaccharide biosynthesis protein [Lutibaculum baratangense]ESR22676.1 hypothetical protein N177_3813 [Lutibaculum baratangense AMV1]